MEREDGLGHEPTSPERLGTTQADVAHDMQRNTAVFAQLAESSLTVAESLRSNYFHNTSRFIAALRTATRRSDAIVKIFSVSDVSWSDVQGEIVTFIDGGVGEARGSTQFPFLLRVGSYSVKTGEGRLAEREQFGYYPVILGDLEGGSRDRKDFVDIVRITAELLGGLAALERMPELRVLMFHGPLVNLMGAYAGHTPFTERDIDVFLHRYGTDAHTSEQLKETFLREARLDIYPRMSPRSDEWVERRLFEPLAWIAFLYRQLISIVRQRNPQPLVAGVVERGSLSEFTERVLLDRVFRSLRERKNGDYFNTIFGRSDLTTPGSVVDRLGYRDALLLSMLLCPGELSEPWRMEKYAGLRHGNVALPGEAATSTVSFASLATGPLGFPPVLGAYLQTTATMEPIRIEVFADLGEAQLIGAARRTYLYSRLLPGYGFPVGLDVADKYARVPAWMTEAYDKLIRLQLGISLQQGDIDDATMREILIQAIYMTHRDWIFRPSG